MSSEIKPDKAINFLSLVRKDLAGIQPPNNSHNNRNSGSTIVTPRSGEFAVDTWVEQPDDAPTVLGRFEIIEQVGEGGFARVFLANDPNLDREVALKVPKPHVLLSAESVARFQREARSAAILSHPNIVPVYESGSLGPIQFIASEFCPGPTLRQWFSENGKKPNPKMAVEIVCCLADALQHAHQRGIIHRDLKPANIILVEGERSTASRLRITDFGLARQLSDDESLTANGAIVGTPAYMSPEQARGKDVVDHRTDIYSLGMILYELLTGKSPFKRKNHMSSIAAVINEAIPAVRESNPKIDLDLEAVCLKALEKDPSSRYQSAHELGTDLQRWIDGRTVSVRQPSRTEKFSRWLRQNPIVAAAVLFSLVCMTAGLAFSIGQWNRAQVSLNQSIQQRDRAERNVDELHSTIVSALEVLLESLEENSTFTPVQLEVLDHLMSAHKRLVEEEAEQVEVTAATFECFERLARVYRKTGRYDEATEICDRADTMLQACMKSESGKQTYALSAALIEAQKAFIFGEQGDLDTQTKLLLKAVEYYQESEAATDRIKWLGKGYYLYRNLGYSYFTSRNSEASRAVFEQAREIATEASALAPEDEAVRFNVARSLLDISHSNRSNDSWPTGLENLEQAEAILMEIDSDPNSEIDCRYRLAYVRYDIALFLRAFVKDYDRAAEYYLNSIAMLKELIDESPGNYAYRNRYSHAYLRLTDVYRDQGKLDEVLRLTPIATEAHLQGMPRRANPRIARTERTRAMALAFENRDNEAAEEAFNKAVEVIESSEYFTLDDALHVNELLETHRQRSIFYEKLGETAKATDATGAGYRLAVQRALKHPGQQNLEAARVRGLSYANRLANEKQYGLAKAVLDTLAEAGHDSAEVQYDLANAWAKMDFNQRKNGEEKELWDASRAKSMKRLSQAIDLGFDDFDRLRKGKFFKDYQHLPEFESNCDRIRPE